MILLKQLEQIAEPRKDINLKHNLEDVVFLTLNVILGGATGWKSIQEFAEEQLDWLRLYRKFENGIPKEFYQQYNQNIGQRTAPSSHIWLEQ